MNLKNIFFVFVCFFIGNFLGYSFVKINFLLYSNKTDNKSIICNYNDFCDNYLQNKLPNTVNEKLNNTKFKITKKSIEELEEFKYHNFSNNKQCVALYFKQSNTIYLSLKDIPNNENMNFNIVSLHEIGHKFDESLSYSNSNTFKKIFEVEKNKIFNSNDNKEKNSEYFLSDINEYFAQCFSMYFWKQESKTELKNKAPNTYEYIKEIIK